MARREVLEATADLVRHAPEFAAIVVAAGPCALRSGRRPRTHFAELARAICYQQLAGAAARSIHGRFAALFDGNPTAEAVLAAPEADLRAAGLSASKTASIRDLASQVVAGTVRLDGIARRRDEQIVEELTRVRGIGRWTAEMFLIFQLGRLDVWPVDDFGVRKGYGRVYSLAVAPTARQLDPLGDVLRPYRSIAAWYCWRACDDQFMNG
jgi:3-methyladenine DNA glycosylase/8-oxoguanine DNA glycosylase